MRISLKKHFTKYAKHKKRKEYMHINEIVFLIKYDTRLYSEHHDK